MDIALATEWKAETDPTGWWMSEKLDGIRAIWTGTEFVSRTGEPIGAPSWFCEGLPSCRLDGELWAGRGGFERVLSVLNGADGWADLIFVAFDAPDATGGFESRQQTLASFRAPFLRIADQQPCRGADHLRSELARLERIGGEGLVLRQPGCKYVAGRSASMQKVKSQHDAEALVIDHIDGKGKHTGKLGSLVCQLANGLTFAIGSGFSDDQRANPPAVGTFITFRHRGFTARGIPRCQSFLRPAINPPDAWEFLCGRAT
jgi:DNA ligase-1